MDDPANAVFSSWSIPIGPAVAILLSFIFYLRGWIRSAVSSPFIAFLSGDCFRSLPD